MNKLLISLGLLYLTGCNSTPAQLPQVPFEVKMSCKRYANKHGDFKATRNKGESALLGFVEHFNKKKIYRDCIREYY